MKEELICVRFLVAGCVFVMICAVTVYFSDPKTAKYIDPIFSIISAVLLLILSYPYSKYHLRTVSLNNLVDTHVNWVPNLVFFLKTSL